MSATCSDMFHWFVLILILTKWQMMVDHPEQTTWECEWMCETVVHGTKYYHTRWRHEHILEMVSLMLDICQGGGGGCHINHNNIENYFEKQMTWYSNTVCIDQKQLV